MRMNGDAEQSFCRGVGVGRTGDGAERILSALLNTNEFLYVD
jgi:hypothetical protein